ncbi:MAG TPA: hypothetical protein VFB19_15835 [Mycobacterium sp.]|nr:hypothetical protein [Mycobacterium sp.]
MAKKMFGVAIAVAGLAAAITVSAAPLATAGSGGTVALPPGGPTTIYPQTQTIGGANPYVPFGTDPSVPYGVWAP